MERHALSWNDRTGRMDEAKAFAVARQSHQQDKYNPGWNLRPAVALGSAALRCIFPDEFLQELNRGMTLLHNSDQARRTCSGLKPGDPFRACSACLTREAMRADSGA